MRFSAIVSVAVTLMGFAAAAPSERATGMQSPSTHVFDPTILTIFSFFIQKFVTRRETTCFAANATATALSTAALMTAVVVRSAATRHALTGSLAA